MASPSLSAAADGGAPARSSSHVEAICAWMRLSMLAPLALAPTPAHAQLEAEAFIGSSVSAPSPLSITQEGQPDIHVTAHWATRPFRPTWYYAWRIGLWREKRGWLLDFTHHKLHMIDRPGSIQQFEISNGVNLVTVSRGFRSGKFSWAVGGGPVITFPRNRVRGLEHARGQGFFGGYFLSGATAMASATRHIPLFAGAFLSLDGRLSATYVRVPVANGHASVPNLAAHLHLGLGYGVPR